MRNYTLKKRKIYQSGENDGVGRNWSGLVLNQFKIGLGGLLLELDYKPIITD